MLLNKLNHQSRRPLLVFISKPFSTDDISKQEKFDSDSLIQKKVVKLVKLIN